MKNMQSIVNNAVENNTVIVVFANIDYQEVAANWIEAVRRLQVENYLVVALDDKIYSLLADAGVRAVLRPCSGDHGSLWIHRVDVILEILELGFDVLHSDADAVWLKNPLDEYIYASDADMVFSQGTIWPPDVHQVTGFVVCCGFFFVRSSRSARQFFADLAIRVRQDRDDQASINRMLLEQNMRWDVHSGYTLTFRGLEFTCSRELITGRCPVLKAEILPHGKFQRCREELPDVYVRHLLSDKNAGSIIDVMKKGGCWFL